MDKEYVVSRGIKVGIIEKGKWKRNGSLGEMRDESFQSQACIQTVTYAIIVHEE